MTDLSMFNAFSNLYIWRKDVNLQFVYLNKTCSEIFGFENVESAIGKNDYEIPSDLTKFADIFRENDRMVMSSDKLTTFLEIQPCANHEWKILHVVKQPYYENGKMQGILGYAIDITKSHIKLEQFINGSQTHFYIGENQTLSSSDSPKLSARESECLFFLLRRYTAKEIAKFLKISFRTVEHYIEILKSKFNCKDKSDLLISAKNLGFLNVIPQTIIGQQLSIVVD